MLYKGMYTYPTGKIMHRNELQTRKEVRARKKKVHGEGKYAAGGRGDGEDAC